MECSYCSKETEETKGKLLVLNSGEKKFFCNSKCEKNWKNDRGHSYGE